MFRNELIDIIEWLDSSGNTLVYRFVRFQNEIKNGAKLIVRESQVAVFINEGTIADVFTPGTYTLNTANLPILSTLRGWKYGFNSPFKAEVYFVSTRNITAQKWGTKNPITISDKRFGMLEMRAFGTYVIRVKDPALLIREIVGTDGHFTTDKIAEQLKSMIVARFTDAAAEANMPIEKYASNINELSEYIHGILSQEFESYGIEITKFLIENISMPKEIKNEIFELSRLNAVNLNQLTQIKAAKAMENISHSDNSGAGMGLGYGMIGLMGNIFNDANRQYSASAPPPPPVTPDALSVHVILNGQQAGPYSKDRLKEMALQNHISRDTLAWYTGMKDWTAAGKLDEINDVFETIPPPIPGK